jgi:hypothetical protein
VTLRSTVISGDGLQDLLAHATTEGLSAEICLTRVACCSPTPTMPEMWSGMAAWSSSAGTHCCVPSW